MLISTLVGTGLTGCLSEEEKFIKEHIDFIVDVESGREPVVLQLTDTQIIDPEQARTPERLSVREIAYWAKDRIDECCYDDIAETIENTKPDLILLTGDNVYGEFDDEGTSFTSLVEYMDSFKIPWAPVFGNHDNECALGADWQCEQFEDAKYCLFKQRELTGNGNYTVGIRQDDEIKRVFFMLDSNGATNGSAETFANKHSRPYSGFGQDQIEWYTETGKTIKEQFPDVKYTFAFHIPLLIFEETYQKYNLTSCEITDKVINIDELEEKEETDFGCIGASVEGSWDSEYLVWDGIKALGVDSVLVGHEHRNSASIMYDGVRLQFGQKTGAYDCVNYQKADGSIYSAYCGQDTPMSGGTVMKLSPKDGSIVDSYIYLCRGLQK